MACIGDHESGQRQGQEQIVTRPGIAVVTGLRDKPDQCRTIQGADDQEDQRGHGSERDALGREAAGGAPVLPAKCDSHNGSHCSTEAEPDRQRNVEGLKAERDTGLSAGRKEAGEEHVDDVVKRVEEHPDCRGYGKRAKV